MPSLNNHGLCFEVLLFISNESISARVKAVPHPTVRYKRGEVFLPTVATGPGWNRYKSVRLSSILKVKFAYALITVLIGSNEEIVPYNGALCNRIFQ